MKPVREEPLDHCADGHAFGCGMGGLSKRICIDNNSLPRALRGGVAIKAVPPALAIYTAYNTVVLLRISLLTWLCESPPDLCIFIPPLSKVLAYNSTGAGSLSFALNSCSIRRRRFFFQFLSACYVRHEDHRCSDLCDPGCRARFCAVSRFYSRHCSTIDLLQGPSPQGVSRLSPPSSRTPNILALTQKL
ncbi:hypothetical protein OE88DRAFT_1146447 [Heliocybe sulcata]|uniref:Uncharacterized protein n=1 Tax=Heliocybe sulcata TaxID=5364 RepID=A0A5C3N9Z2_9AGAM|nr:hypothetical protein OE88DRAFT_1146447 [Heliocybe sulcata]